MQAAADAANNAAIDSLVKSMIDGAVQDQRCEPELQVSRVARCPHSFIAKYAYCNMIVGIVPPRYIHPQRLELMVCCGNAAGSSNSSRQCCH